MNFKYFIIGISVLLIVSCTACKTQSEDSTQDIKTSVEKTTPEKNYIEGQITIVGNEPFTKLGLIINDSTIYQLECDNDTKDILWNNQGKFYKIFFDNITGNIVEVNKVDKTTGDDIPLSEKDYFEGQITIIGNEPFTKLGLLVNDSTIYQLNCDTETKDILWKNQGKFYKIFFNEISGNKVTVRKVEKINN